MQKMIQDEWVHECNAVKRLMIDYVARLPTPISKSQEYGIGVAWGTGNYLNISGEGYLLSNAHVYSDCPADSVLAHLPVNGGDYIAIVNKPYLAPYPIDAGISKLPKGSFPIDRAILNSHMDQVFFPVEDELVFWTGFPGYDTQRNERPTEARLKTNLYTPDLEIDAQSFLTQLAKLDQDKIKLFDAVKHVAIHYPAMAYKSTSQDLQHCANPKGMSGSLLWDTKYVAHRLQGKMWSPECAKVCGLIWAAHEHPEEVVVATKIEYVLEALNLKLAEV